MNKEQADYIILGQGISGSFLSYYLIKAGKKVLVIDESKPFTASKIASGVINPVTGRRVVQTWLIDEIMPFAVAAYQELGNLTGASLIQQCNVLSFHGNVQMRQAWEDRNAEENLYLKKPDNVEALSQYFNFYYSVGETNPCYLADMPGLISGWRRILLETNCLLEEKFEWEHCSIKEGKVFYKNWEAAKIICCDGVSGTENPYFQLLPYAKNKGEALIAEIEGLPRTHIYKQNITVTPWKENLFWVGSQYEWNYADALPSAGFRIKTELLLRQWVKLPFKITDHFAAERPANIERRPFAGLHPLHPEIGILNGMGTKGCSLAPYFAHQLTEMLLHQTALNPLADVSRFSKILSR